MATSNDSSFLQEWVNAQLSEILSFPVPDDMSKYILSIENSRDLENYLRDLLDFNNKRHYQFFLQLQSRRQPGVMGVPPDVQAYKKSDVQEDYIVAKASEKKKKNKNQNNEGKFQFNEEGANKEKEMQKERILHGKKKQKFISLYSQEGQAKDIILLKGRHNCDCQATKHKLINNCLTCGRIVCEQEGSGPCFFCGNLVCTREEREMLNSGSKQSAQLRQKLMDQECGKGWEAALKQRNRLLEYDRTSEKRTQVIDDESDYFQSNSVWLSKEEREKIQKREEELRERRHASRLNTKVTFDFAGRQVIEDDNTLEDIYDPNDYVLKEINESLQRVNVNSETGIIGDSNVDPNVSCHVLTFQDSHNSKSTSQQSNVSPTTARRIELRIQDKEILEMSDDGKCLSMHQPWASLLIAGIKVHEGRTWYTPHRGRLWIASAKKVPTSEEIRETENIYRVLLGEENVKFPSSYPTSSLLGCVDVEDCVHQEEYRKQFPEGESTSPFVFICKNPQELPIKFPTQGQHKIYKLEPKIHQAALKSLQRIAKLKAEKFKL